MAWGKKVCGRIKQHEHEQHSKQASAGSSSASSNTVDSNTQRQQRRACCSGPQKAVAQQRQRAADADTTTFTCSCVQLRVRTHYQYDGIAVRGQPTKFKGPENTCSVNFFLARLQCQLHSKKYGYVLLSAVQCLWLPASSCQLPAASFFVSN